MVSKLTPLVRLIGRLDALDGRHDGFYLKQQIQTSPAVDACLFRRGLVTKPPQIVEEGRFRIMVEGGGSDKTIDCKALVSQLNMLIGVSKKMPMTGVAAATKASLKKADRSEPVTINYKGFSAEQLNDELMGYFMISSMIYALMNVNVLPDASNVSLFLSINFKDCSNHVNQSLPTPPESKPYAIDNAALGYAVLASLGRKHGFNPTTFMPPPSRIGTPAVPL